MPKTVNDDKLDLINVSSATSTPINCKSNDWNGSVQNSSLKKRDFKEFKILDNQNQSDKKENKKGS